MPAEMPNSQGEYHPAFIHGRREMIFILVVWVVALLWVVPYCYWQGFVHDPANFDPEQLETVLGMPAWVVWGIAVPWLAANLITIVFCFGFMTDDDLGEANEGEDLAEEIAERRAKREGSR